MANKDKRTKCANEIFSSIKFIKVNALEEFFVEKLLEFRKKEDRSLKTNYTFSCLAILSVYLSPMLVLNATFGMFIGLGNNLTPANTFAIISLF